MKQESQDNSNEGRKQRSLNIAFLVCDEPAESTLKKHGGFDEYICSSAVHWLPSSPITDHPLI
jgi:hypothetical protein